MTTDSYAVSWNDVAQQLREVSVDTVIQIATTEIEHPKNAGMFVTPFTSEDGRPIYGAFLDQTTGYLVHDCGDNYQAKKHPFAQPGPVPTPAVAPQPAAAPLQSQAHRPVPVEALPVLVDARRLERHSFAGLSAQQLGFTFLGVTAVGALFGALVGGDRGAAYGALIGCGAGLAAVTICTAVTSPAIAAAAQTMFMGLAAGALSGSGGSRILRLAPARQVTLPSNRDDGTSGRQPPTRRTTRKKSPPSF